MALMMKMKNEELVLSVTDETKAFKENNHLSSDVKCPQCANRSFLRAAAMSARAAVGANVVKEVRLCLEVESL